MLRPPPARADRPPRRHGPDRRGGAVQGTVRPPRLCSRSTGKRAMAEIRMSEDQDGRWTIFAAGLVVTDLTRDAAEAFIASYRRITAL
ncbi:hypothetical protein FOHLNKBM_2748 [Methylobacterium longum]|nr:hypothetical protein FOHLNKBM_2748 [Methylobacterium longum]